MHLFITGTDSGVGKTHIACALLRAARRAGRDAVGWKPICCGDRDDAEALWEASERSAELNEVNPVWFRTPAAPYTAALVENRPADLALVREVGARLARRHAMVIAEGAGGWEVPIEAGFRFSDLASELGWPVLLVAANRLGALNHTLLTVQAIEARGLRCAGVVLNRVSVVEDVATTTNAGVLETLLGRPVLELSHREDPERVAVAALISSEALPYSAQTSTVNITE